MQTTNSPLCFALKGACVWNDPGNDPHASSPQVKKFYRISKLCSFGGQSEKEFTEVSRLKSRLLFLMRNEATLTRGAKSHFSFPSALVWEVFLLPGDSCMDFVIWGLKDFHPQRIPDPFVHTANSLAVPASSTLSSRNCSENSKSVTLESPGDPNSLPPSQMFLNQTEL